MPERLFMDGTGITPGTEGCKCGPSCEFPCWQRIGLTTQPCCKDCPPLVEEDKAQTPGAMEIEVEREVPGGTIRFEQSPAGWLSKNGQPRVQDWRAYFWVPDEGKRVRLPSVTTWLSSILPKDLTRFGEEHGIRGCMEAIRRGELEPTHDDDFAVSTVRALKLGSDAARDRAATRGIDVHSMLEEWSRTGTFPPVPLELGGFVQGLQNFLAEYDPEPTAVELLVADMDRGYAGRFDLRAICRSKAFPHRANRVIDLKTAKSLRFFESHHYQTQSYRVADMKCGGPESDTPLIVCVDAEGRFDVMDCAVSESMLEDALAFYQSKKPVTAMCDAFYRQQRAA